MRFVDTNVFIRYITRDSIPSAEAAQEVLERIRDGIEEGAICEAVVCEIVYVLRSNDLYKMHPAEIKDKVRPLLMLQGMRIANRSVYLDALDLIVEQPSLDFEDAICVGHMKRLDIAEIYSFDKGFDRVEGVRRIRPGAV